MSNESNTTDAIVHDPEASKGEKLDRLRDMGYELKRYATKNEASVDEVEAKVAGIEHVELETTRDFFDLFVDGCQFRPMPARLSSETAVQAT